MEISNLIHIGQLIEQAYKKENMQNKNINKLKNYSISF